MTAGCHPVTDMDELPDWPAGTVAILVTGGERPHAIPVSAVVRAGPRRVLIGLANGRESLARLRRSPPVTVAICARDVAVSVDGTAAVLAEELVDGVAAVAVEVEAIHDHDRPTFALHAGVAWEWTDEVAARRDSEVQAALRRLAETS
jgi:flavin reductase (DIM6/NTAB) family NADH-FMN oxidoreductase RutF